MNTSNQQQLLRDLCEDPGSFIELVEDWAKHKHPDSFLIKRLFTRHNLIDQVHHAYITDEPFQVDGEFINPLQVVFQLRDDYNIYRLFGRIENGNIHVALARLPMEDFIFQITL